MDTIFFWMEFIYSYQFIRIDQVIIPFGNENLIEFIIKAFSQMFLIALQMSIPVVGSLFLVDIGLGIVARTVPQLNIFVVGIPVKMLVSFLVLMIVMGMMMVVVQQLFEYFTCHYERFDAVDRRGLV